MVGTWRGLGVNHYVSLSVIQTTDVYLCDNRYTSSESSPEDSKSQSLLVRWLNPFNAGLSLETYWREPGFQELGKRETISNAVLCHHRDYSCIKEGSDESHFNVSFTVRDKVKRVRLSTDHSF